jgi:PAP2 superfamily
MVPTSIMTLDRAGLRQLDGLIWAIIAAVAAAVLASLVLSDFRLVWASFLAPATIASAFAVGQWLYQTRRPDPRLAAALGSTAQIVAFSAVGAPLSYLAASLNFPLYDHWFEAADKALGLDWFGLLDWLKGHATAGFLLRLVYVSLMPQTLVVILALSLAGRFAALRIFVLAFVFAALVTIAISAFWPAQGVWLLHGMTASDGLSLPVSATSWPVFLGLRDGTFRLLMAGGRGRHHYLPQPAFGARADSRRRALAAAGAAVDRRRPEYDHDGVDPDLRFSLFHRHAGGHRHCGCLPVSRARDGAARKPAASGAGSNATSGTRHYRPLEHFPAK